MSLPDSLALITTTSTSRFQAPTSENSGQAVNYDAPAVEMISRRTCDRCYKIKARCDYSQDSAACARCSRLGHSCQKDRAVLPPGRPRTVSKPRRSPTAKRRLSDTQSESPSSPTLTLEVGLLPIWKGFEPHEIPLVEFVLHPDQISSLVFGQTFWDSTRSSLALQIVTASEQLKDGILALATALLEQKSPGPVGLSITSPTDTGSRALRKLANLTIGSVEDARTALGLALMLITYNDLRVGAPTLPISRSALLQAMPYRSQLIRATSDDMDPNMICVLLAELTECLVLGQVPVFRYEPAPGNTVVDRYYGVCHELFPMIYDICVLCRGIRHGSISRAERIFRAESIASSVDEWIPESALESRKDIIVDAREQQHFFLQARAFKSAIQLLLLQTQRSPIHDSLARAKAVQLHSEVLQVLQQGTGRPNYVLFPYFVANLESLNTDLDDEGNMVFKSMHLISNGMAPRACQTMVACLTHIWYNRRQRPDLTWFECVDDGIIVAMGP